MALGLERQAWEDELIESGLVEWFCEDDGKILSLIGTQYLLVSKKIWFWDQREDRSAQALSSEDLKIIRPDSDFLEGVFLSLSEDMQLKMIFNWDLFL